MTSRQTKNHRKIFYLLPWFVKQDSVNSFSLNINKTNGYVEEDNANNYLTLAHTDEMMKAKPH